VLVLGLCGTELLGGDLQRAGDALGVEVGALEQLGRDEAGARVAAGVLVGVRAGQDAGEDGLSVVMEQERTLTRVSGFRALRARP
jgi:hypothetical protein